MVPVYILQIGGMGMGMFGKMDSKRKVLICFIPLLPLLVVFGKFLIEMWIETWKWFRDLPL